MIIHSQQEQEGCVDVKTQNLTSFTSPADIHSQQPFQSQLEKADTVYRPVLTPTGTPKQVPSKLCRSGGLIK